MAVSTSCVLLCVLLVRQLATGSTCSSGFFLSENRNCVACPEHCVDCDSENDCLYCEKGYWGKVCELSCSNCMTGTSCGKANGFCKGGCTYGYSGLLCNDKCDNKCLYCTRGNRQNCSRCAPGRYPIPYCDNICAGCHEQNCDETGVCALRCVDGFWGQKCEKKCSQNCTYASCDRDNGTCTAGDKNSMPVIPVVVAVAVGAIVLAVITCSVLCLRRRRTRQKSRQDYQPEVEELLEVYTAVDQENEGASRSRDKLQTIRIYLRKEEVCREIHETGVNLFDCLFNCIYNLISLDESNGSTKEKESFVNAETLQKKVETLLKSHAGSWKAMFPLLVDEFPLPKSDPNESEQTEYLEQIEETFMKITLECSEGAYTKTYTKLLLYASATCINIPIYVISFDQQWHYFEPLFDYHEMPKRILRYITVFVCQDNLFYKVESTDHNAPPPKATGIVGMYRKCLEDTPTLSINVPDELTNMPESSKTDLCKSVGEDLTKECCDILLDAKLINKKEYTSLTTKADRLENFLRKITGSEDAFGIFCKVLIKRRRKSILSPFTHNLRLFVKSCEYLSQYEALYSLDNAIVERNAIVIKFVDACLSGEKELNETRKKVSTAVIAGSSIDIATGSLVIADVLLAPFSFGASFGLSIAGGVTAGTAKVVDVVKERSKLKDIEEIQMIMHEKESKVCSEVENVENLFKTTLKKDHESAVGSPGINKSRFLAVGSAFRMAHSVAFIALAAARLGSTAVAVSAAVLGPLSLVTDIAFLAEAAKNKRKEDKTNAEEKLQSVREIVKIKCKIFNSMLRGNFEEKEKMFEPFSC